MSNLRIPPKMASVATPTSDDKLFSPSAARNTKAIVALMKQKAPATGTALELASGTGQHIVELARACPNLRWQPSEFDKARHPSITAYVAQAELTNVAPVVALDATTSSWGRQHHGQDLIFLANLLHLISHTEAETLVHEAAQALAPGGMLIIYGPFMRDNKLISDSDAAFHASLQAQDATIGYKCRSDVIVWGTDALLEVSDIVDMPANNLALCWRKPGSAPN
ncbi:DUF938 domain-containing protein [Shimia sp.]|uniref:DUF938 domain-containing protein n=1 Tax=Shimia sp. TaxID=1954381 RepID=UPI00329A233B